MDEDFDNHRRIFFSSMILFYTIQGLFELGISLRLRSRHALRWREDYVK